MKAIEQYFRAVLFFMLCSMILTSKSVTKTPVYDHVNKSCPESSGLFTFLDFSVTAKLK